MAADTLSVPPSIVEFQFQCSHSSANRHTLVRAAIRRLCAAGAQAAGAVPRPERRRRRRELPRPQPQSRPRAPAQPQSQPRPPPQPFSHAHASALLLALALPRRLAAAPGVCHIHLGSCRSCSSRTANASATGVSLRSDAGPPSCGCPSESWVCVPCRAHVCCEK